MFCVTCNVALCWKGPKGIRMFTGEKKLRISTHHESQRSHVLYQELSFQPTMWKVLEVNISFSIRGILLVYYLYSLFHCPLFLSSIALESFITLTALMHPLPHVRNLSLTAPRNKMEEFSKKHSWRSVEQSLSYWMN